MIEHARYPALLRERLAENHEQLAEKDKSRIVLNICDGVCPTSTYYHYLRTPPEIVRYNDFKLLVALTKSTPRLREGRYTPSKLKRKLENIQGYLPQIKKVALFNYQSPDGKFKWFGVDKVRTFTSRYTHLTSLLEHYDVTLKIDIPRLRNEDRKAQRRMELWVKQALLKQQLSIVTNSLKIEEIQP